MPRFWDCLGCLSHMSHTERVAGVVNPLASQRDDGQSRRSVSPSVPPGWIPVAPAKLLPSNSKWQIVFENLEGPRVAAWEEPGAFPSFPQHVCS